jgi:hypothetical protein
LFEPERHHRQTQLRPRAPAPSIFVTGELTR